MSVGWDGQVGDKRDRDWLRCPPPLALLLIPEHASGRGRERGPRMHACKHRPTAWGHHAISGKEGEERGERVQGDSFTSPSFSDEGAEGVVSSSSCCSAVLQLRHLRRLFPRGAFGEEACEQKCKGSNAVCWMRRRGNERVGCASSDLCAHPGVPISAAEQMSR